MTRHARTTSRRSNLARGALYAFSIALSGVTLCAVIGCEGHSAANKTLEHGGSNNNSEPVLSLELPSRVVELTGIKTAVASKPTRLRELQLRGSLALDVNRLVHVHARFPGQIVSLATVPDRQSTVDEEAAAAAPSAPKTGRPLNFMDRVTKGQKLGEIWSKDLGEKKSELVDALVQLRIDQQNLKYQEQLLSKGATAEKQVREAERQVEVRKIAVAKAERTLRSWSLGPEEIQEVKDEADRIHKGGSREMQQDETWASVDIVSPIDGTIVEKNVVKGDLVNTDSDLFKVADLSVLSAWARIYEEELPLLQSMPKPVSWKLRLNSNPQARPIPGTIDRIGDLIDPNEHMALLAGLVKNPNDQYHAGQFITAIIDLPPETDVVEIPTRALVEDGDESVVLVQGDPEVHRYTLRRVVVVRRHHDVVYVRSHLTSAQQSRGLQELKVGETVVSAGALELKAALQEKQSTQKAQ